MLCNRKRIPAGRITSSIRFPSGGVPQRWMERESQISGSPLSSIGELGLSASNRLFTLARCLSGVGLLVVLLQLGCSPSATLEVPNTNSTVVESEETVEVKHDISVARNRENRLSRETSPYLLLHAHNPVDWYPWGEEALAKAKSDNKLIFLSIGYSSCFWCHVMERESFMDEEIAKFLNEHFICIKVDREERPDIDSVYMTAVQILTRRGGWPMSVFLVPDSKPFFGGSYFPARDGDRAGTTGFLTIVRKLQQVWMDEPESILETANRLAELLKRELERRKPMEPVDLDKDLLNRVAKELESLYDPEYGGFGFSLDNPQRPKFPEPSKLLFLVDYVRRTDDAPSRAMLENTLDHMAEGGLRDHLAGGFHRYSTDRYWNIPHFEKMLYDNGQLATVYAEAYQLTGGVHYRYAVEEMLHFVLREMTAESGGFYAALDAETDAEEGKFYRWTQSELKEELSADEWKLLAPVYGFDGPANFEHDFHVPLLSIRFRDITTDELERRETSIRSIRQKLVAVRDCRSRPLTDTKIITSWNGLMIRGFADAGRIFENEDYIRAACRAADFLLDELQTEEGRLHRSHAGGRASFNAYLDDYTYLVSGFIALHRATGDDRWLVEADRLTSQQIDSFVDEENGGFYFTSNDHESLLARAKDPVDGVRPAGISMAAVNLVYLGVVLERSDYLELAETTIQSSADLFRNSPASVTQMAIAVSDLLSARNSETVKKNSIDESDR